MLHMVISNAWSLEDPIDADVEKGALVSPTGEEIAMIHLDKGGVVGRFTHAQGTFSCKFVVRHASGLERRIPMVLPTLALQANSRRKQLDETCTDARRCLQLRMQCNEPSQRSICKSLWASLRIA